MKSISSLLMQVVSPNYGYIKINEINQIYDSFVPFLENVKKSIRLYYPSNEDIYKQIQKEKNQSNLFSLLKYTYYPSEITFSKILQP